MDATSQTEALTPDELQLVVAHLRDHSAHHVDAEQVPAYMKVLQLLERQSRTVDSAEQERKRIDAAVALLSKYWRGVQAEADMGLTMTTDQVLQVLATHEPGCIERETLVRALRAMGAAERLYSNDIYWLLATAQNPG